MPYNSVILFLKTTGFPKIEPSLFYAISKRKYLWKFRNIQIIRIPLIYISTI